MLYNLNLERILFLDIETVPIAPTYDELPEKFREHWDKKAERLRKSETETPDQMYQRAGIYAEFGKIVCISVGFLKNNEFRLKSFYGEDEKQLLKEFANLLAQYYNSQMHLLCAHNGKEFDYPYIARRMVINGIKLPDIINIAGKKPWEVAHLDTMELWKFGDYKSYTSLDLLATVFGIPTPKDDIDGSQVAEIYYKENDLERIKEYCQKDTLTVAQLLLCYLGKPMINEDNIIYT